MPPRTVDRGNGDDRRIAQRTSDSATVDSKLHILFSEEWRKAPDQEFHGSIAG